MLKNSCAYISTDSSVIFFISFCYCLYYALSHSQFTILYLMCSLSKPTIIVSNNNIPIASTSLTLLGTGKNRHYNTGPSLIFGWKTNSNKYGLMFFLR